MPRIKLTQLEFEDTVHTWIGRALYHTGDMKALQHVKYLDLTNTSCGFCSAKDRYNRSVNSWEAMKLCSDCAACIPCTELYTLYSYNSLKGNNYKAAQIAFEVLELLYDYGVKEGFIDAAD